MENEERKTRELWIFDCKKIDAIERKKIKEWKKNMKGEEKNEKKAKIFLKERRSKRRKVVDIRME